MHGRRYLYKVYSLLWRERDLASMWAMGSTSSLTGIGLLSDFISKMIKLLHFG